MNDKQYFHFTIGPVQSFVGQARRTRDFWAGSFLLSWLSGVAMQSVITQQRHLSSNETLDVDDIILFPRADRNFLNAIANGCDEGNAPKQGGIPNRFKAKVDANFDPQQVISDVQTAWKELANKIYKDEIAKHISNNTQNHTQSIWDRQVKSFWDMTWVLVNAKNDSSSLDRRKNWRSHYLPDEAGIKCSLMGDWQELSGIVGVSKKDRVAREAFWQTIAKGKTADFSPKEQLCAISYIKRRFLDYFKKFEVDLPNKVELPNKFTANGWALPKSVPSVAHIASAPWFAHTIKQFQQTHEFKHFIDEAKKLVGSPEYDSLIHCIDDTNTSEELKGLDGNVFHETALRNANIFPKRDGNKDIEYDNNGQATLSPQAVEVDKALQALSELTFEDKNKKIKKLGKATPFYAVLMMDGDELGKQMSDTDKQDAITDGLAQFTAQVPNLVSENNGFLIYAGGDDVLALVTLEDALSCALAIRGHYENCFKESDIKTSISAAIIYTHINSPLKNVLHEAHELLDNIAKEKAGRDALAVRVYKGSGLAVEWAKKWNEAIQKIEKNGQKTFECIVDTISQNFQQQSEDNEQFSNKFFYKIRQRFDLLYGKDGSQQSPLSPEQAIDLMAMEYLQSVDKRSFTISDAIKAVTPLIEQSYNAAKDNKVTADAALLVRFLVQKGIEGGRN